MARVHLCFDPDLRKAPHAQVRRPEDGSGVRGFTAR